MARAIRSIVVMLSAALLTACTTVELSKSEPAQGQAMTEAVLNQKIDALLSQQRQICMDPKYADLRGKSPCQTSEITFKQLTDNAKITSGQRIQLIEASTQMDRINKEITALYAAFGTEQATRVAQARQWAYEQSITSRLNLVNQKITWGQYLDQRVKINTEMLRKAQ